MSLVDVNKNLMHSKCFLSNKSLINLTLEISHNYKIINAQDLVSVSLSYYISHNIC